MSVLLLNGPPFSPKFWFEVQHRLHQHSIESHTLDFLHQADDLLSATNCIRKEIKKKNIRHLVAHGLAVPAAISVSRQQPLENLILSNGPLGAHRLLKLINVPKFLLHPLLHPLVSIPIFASSIAFRRLVINPYVMNRDTIVSLCQNNLSSAKYRRNTVNYLHSLNNLCPFEQSNISQCTFIWGDSDRIFSLKEIDSTSTKNPRTNRVLIAGGAHLHPIERPWAIGDHIKQIITN